LAFLPDRNTISALELQPDGTFATLPATGDARYRMCQNAVDHGACSWAVRADDPDGLCRACRLDETLPDLSLPDAKEAWLRLEAAKRRLICNLSNIGLPVPAQLDAEQRKLRFAFVNDAAGGENVSDGLITIHIADPNDPFCEKLATRLDEQHRTLLGQFRHEVGHYYWDQLIKDSPRIEPFRALFGDERPPHRADPPADWQARFVSAYAAVHPREDWAETWAHYLHIIDTLETARAYDMVLNAKPEQQSNTARVAATRVDPEDFESLYRAWVPFTLALNSLQRSTGHRDAYPFVLSGSAVEKLRFVHGVVQSCKVTEVSPTDNTSQLTRSTVMKAVAIDPDANDQAGGA
jgi:hypothetical protein